MRISRRFKRIVSAMLATALAFTMTFSTDVMPLADSKQDQLKAEVSAKQAELDKVNAALKEAQSNKENAEAIKSQLRRINGDETVSTRASVLYLTILNETRTMVLQLRNLLKAQRHFLETKGVIKSWLYYAK